MAKRREQRGWIGVLPPVLVKPGDDGFDRVHLRTCAAQMPDQRCRQKGLADIGAGAGDESSSHCAGIARASERTSTRLRISSASRLIASSGCCAVKVKRSRDVPCGTVVSQRQKPILFKQLRTRKRRLGFAKENWDNGALRLGQLRAAGK